MYNTLIIIQQLSSSRLHEQIDFPYSCNVNLYFKIVDKLSKGNNSISFRNGSICYTLILIVQRLSVQTATGPNP